MAIKWRIKQESFMDKVEIARVDKTIALLKLGDAVAIDSYSMSPNGPILSSIFLVSGGYLVEVAMGGKHLSWDAASASFLINYRVTYGEHEVAADVLEAPNETVATKSEGKATTTKLVTVLLQHTDVLATQMSFFGENVEPWLEFVIENISPKLVTHNN